jgi:TPR repeat protein
MEQFLKTFFDTYCQTTSYIDLVNTALKHEGDKMEYIMSLTNSFADQVVQGKAQNILGLYYSSIKNDEEAEKWYMLASENGNAEACGNMALVGVRKNNLVDAEKWLKKSADLGNLMFRGHLAKLLVNQKRYDEAFPHFKIIAETEVDKNNKELMASRSYAYSDMGYIYFQQKKYKEAEHVLLEALKYNPHSSISLHLVDVYMELGNVKEAEVWLNKSAESGNAYAMLVLGNKCEDAKDYKSAETWYRKAYEAKELEGAYSLGRMYYDLSNFEEALKYLSISAEESEAVNQYNVGATYYQLLRFEEALVWLNKASKKGYEDATNLIRHIEEQEKDVTNI